MAEGFDEVRVGGSDDGSADGDEEVFVGTLNDGVNASAAAGPVDERCALRCLEAVRIVDDVWNIV